MIANMEKQHGSSQPRPDQLVVLVADDEPTVLDFVRMALEGAGYFVLAARDGEEALAVSRSFPGAVHAALSDVKMPRLDGPGMVEQLRAERPGVRVLFMSGQTDGSPLYGCSFLRKPFSPSQLREHVARLFAQAMTA
jgi:CheY-like chemotaxis protein